jgi:hypothetical protein
VDAAGPDGGNDEPAPSPDDVQQHIQRMRELPVEQVIGDIVFSLLNAAQIKLGRRDARLLIDVTAVAHEHARPYLPDKLTKHVDEALGQLRLGQVSAEGPTGAKGEPEKNDLERVPTPPVAGAAQSSGNDHRD